MSAPTALLVDYGGVLTTSIRDSFIKFCDAEGIPGDVFASALFGDGGSIIASVETGALSDDEFDAAIAQRLSEAVGRPIASAGIKDRLFDHVRSDAWMRDAVRAAREAGVRTALVSNSWGAGGYPMDELAPLFDEMLISGEIGMRKPDPDIYLAAAARVGTEPDACIFVDDLKHNIAGAEAVGMIGVLHRTAEATIERLGVLLSVPMPLRPR